ncbi:MAG: hypothetical protein ABIG20_01010 [archaeon]
MIRSSIIAEKIWEYLRDNLGKLKDKYTKPNDRVELVRGIVKEIGTNARTVNPFFSYLLQAPQKGWKVKWGSFFKRMHEEDVFFFLQLSLFIYKITRGGARKSGVVSAIGLGYTFKATGRELDDVYKTGATGFIYSYIRKNGSITVPDDCTKVQAYLKDQYQKHDITTVLSTITTLLLCGSIEVQGAK